MKKGLSVSVKVQEMNKDGFQQFLGMILYGLFALVAFLVRLVSIVVYFAIPLGLWNLLAHYQYESNGFRWKEDVVDDIFNEERTQSGRIFLSDVTVSESEEEISITKYTGLTMKNYYAIFLIGMATHFLLMMLKDVVLQTGKEKHLTNGAIYKDAKVDLPTEEEESVANDRWFTSFLRAITSYVLPELSMDWDERPQRNGFYGNDQRVIEVIVNFV